jgi:hypothetical protein
MPTPDQGGKSSFTILAHSQNQDKYRKGEGQQDAIPVKRYLSYL